MSLIRPAPTLTLEAAKRLASGAEAEAVKRGWTVAVAVVDPSGGLILFHSLDGTQPASQDVAVLKARTAARFKRPTKALEDAIAAGRAAMITMPGAVALEGGVPVMAGGQLVGAIGVSGMTSPEDGLVAAAAIAALGEIS
jgi:glc operon protein GlcG